MCFPLPIYMLCKLDDIWWRCDKHDSHVTDIHVSCWVRECWSMWTHLEGLTCEHSLSMNAGACAIHNAPWLSIKITSHAALVILLFLSKCSSGVICGALNLISFKVNQQRARYKYTQKQKNSVQSWLESEIYQNSALEPKLLLLLLFSFYVLKLLLILLLYICKAPIQ